MINARNSPLFALGKHKWDQFVASYVGPYDFSISVYAGMNRKVHFVCPSHGAQKSDAKNLIAGKRCPQCAYAARAGKLRLTHNKMIERFIFVHGAAYDYSRVKYKGQQIAVEIVCQKHGAFMQKPEYHWNGSGCPVCFDERRGDTSKDTLETFSVKAKAVFGDLFDLSACVYVHSQHDIIVRCTKHKLDCTTRPNWFLSGCNPCRKCNRMRSRAEVEIADFLAQHVRVERRNRAVLSPKELDIWLPDLKIGVEYHGLYWHTEPYVKYTHRRKWDMAQKAGIRLIQIFEDEWRDKRAVVESRLLAAIGKAPVIYARNTSIVPVDIKTAGAFLEVHHTQGAGMGAAIYGLMCDNQLVAVATFGKARGGAMSATIDGVWEVYRYASVGRVVGGFSKLFKHFVSVHQPPKVVSYCDLRYGTGGLYKATGFNLESISEPDYWWVPRGKAVRISRYKTQKHKISKISELIPFYASEKSEKQICEDAGWSRIFGVGNQKWVWVP